jgi:hypothetical protein
LSSLTLKDVFYCFWRISLFLAANSFFTFYSSCLASRQLRGHMNTTKEILIYSFPSFLE